MKAAKKTIKPQVSETDMEHNKRSVRLKSVEFTVVDETRSSTKKASYTRADVLEAMNRTG